MRKNNNLAPEGVEVSEEAELMVGTSEVGKKRDYFLPVSILIAGVLIAGSVVYMVLNKNTGATPGVNNLPAVGANAGGGAGAGGTTNGGNIPQLGNRDVILGNPNAPVTFIEYADYQCPFCTKFFSETQPLLVTNYVQTGKMKMVFRNFPFLGPESLAAATAAECAKDQSKFWAYHDALYGAETSNSRGENSGYLTRDLFMKLAANVGIDTKAFASCIDSGKYTAQVQKDTADAQAAGVNSTPTSYINGQQFLGALPYQQFADAIDAALKTK